MLNGNNTGTSIAMEAVEMLPRPKINNVTEIYPGDKEQEIEPTFIERQLHNAGYIVMGNLPPAKFWNWANIGNIVAVLLFLSAVIGVVWTVGVTYGTKTEQDKQRDNKIFVLEEELRKTKEAEYLNQADATPTPTIKEKRK